MKLIKTFRAMLLAETLNNVEREALGKEPIAFNLSTQQQVAYYLFAIYTTSNPEEGLTYDAFLDRMDDPDFSEALYKWMSEDLAESALTTSKKKDKKERK